MGPPFADGGTKSIAAPSHSNEKHHKVEDIGVVTFCVPKIANSTSGTTTEKIEKRHQMKEFDPTYT